MAKEPNGARTKQIIQIGRDMGYTKYNKIAHCMAENPQYGLARVPDFQAAVDKLDGAATATQKPRRADKRKDNARISCWMPEAVKRKFNRSKKYRNYVTDHDYILWLILDDAERIKQEKAAQAADTDLSGRGDNSTSKIQHQEAIVNAESI